MASKEALLVSKRFKYNHDVLSALLEDKKDYDLKEVDKLLKNYYKKEVV